MEIWFTDDEKKMIRIITNKSQDKAVKLRKYLTDMRYLSVTGEDKEFLEDIIQEISIKTNGLTDEKLEKIICGL